MFARTGLTDADVSKISRKQKYKQNKNKLVAIKISVMCMSLVTGIILEILDRKIQEDGTERVVT